MLCCQSLICWVPTVQCEGDLFLLHVFIIVKLESICPSLFHVKMEDSLLFVGFLEDNVILKISNLIQINQQKLQQSYLKRDLRGRSMWDKIGSSHDCRDLLNFLEKGKGSPRSYVESDHISRHKVFHVLFPFSHDIVVFVISINYKNELKPLWKTRFYLRNQPRLQVGVSLVSTQGYFPLGEEPAFECHLGQFGTRLQQKG